MNTFQIFLIISFLFDSSPFEAMYINENIKAQVAQLILYFKSAPPPYIPDYIIENPKVSVVIPIYNGEQYIHGLIRSIQYQTLLDIEILFVDDCSTDNTFSILKKYHQEDKRITIIRNEKNRGILYNRIYGALQSRGEYVTYLDADDLYCNNQIFELAYNAGVNNNYVDLVQFDHFGGFYDGMGKFGETFLFTSKKKNYYNIVIKQPDIKKLFLYYEGEDMFIISNGIYDKLYSRKAINKMADYIGEDIWNSNLSYLEDYLMVFATTRIADTLYLLSYAGMWHWFANPLSVTDSVHVSDGHKLRHPKKQNKKFLSELIVYELLFDYTEDEPDAEPIRINILKIISGQDDSREVFALSYHFERLLILIERFYYWKYTSKETKKYIKQYGRETINYAIDLKEKYKIFYKKKNKKNKEDL